MAGLPKSFHCGWGAKICIILPSGAGRVGTRYSVMSSGGGSPSAGIPLLVLPDPALQRNPGQAHDVSSLSARQGKNQRPCFDLPVACGAVVQQPSVGCCP